jgi:hypothetical protein
MKGSIGDRADLFMLARCAQAHSLRAPSSKPCLVSFLMPKTLTPPPPVPIDELKVAANIDFITLARPTTRRVRLPALSSDPILHKRLSNGLPGSFLTLHDPTLEDVVALSSVFLGEPVMALEVAVDFMPAPGIDDSQLFPVLEQTFGALAGRFRPEHHALWDHGSRGAVSARRGPVQPLERRFARMGEELIYGRRHDCMQAKLYYKTLDQDVILEARDQKIRTEITLRREGCIVFGINQLSDLVGYPFRQKFAKQFRVIDRPEVRLLRGLTGFEQAHRQRRLERAWSTAGVAKFAVGDRPREVKVAALLKHVEVRERIQLPSEHYKLVCDLATHAKIGSALMNLQRRFRPPRSEKSSCSVEEAIVP